MRRATLFAVLCATVVSFQIHASPGLEIGTKSGIRVSLDAHRRSFKLTLRRPKWVFSGIVDGMISSERKAVGKDKIGTFEEIAFITKNGISYRNSIRSYRNKTVVLFQQEALDSLAHQPMDFPVFSEFPGKLSLMTFSEREFGAPQVFRTWNAASDTASRVHSGPLLFFDAHCRACIISPASEFMISSVTENGTAVRCGLNSGLTRVPRGYRESTVFVFGDGINRTWEVWGQTLTDLHQKKKIPNDVDTGLKYLSYWTDNGAFYYYCYDTSKGYDGTLLALKKHYDEEHIPIRSMQLDSWWYPKGHDNPDGSVERSDRRISSLPAGTWNRFGGLTEYIASDQLFPRGLRTFHDSLHLPLITHSRWIARESPYHAEYKISGIGSVDPRWWNDIMKSIASWGVTTYEQDWLDRIYENSPEFSLTTWAAEEFMSEMAAAARKLGLTIQYCMPLPRHYLEGGAKYSHVTTIRVSGDRFQRVRWKEFLYGSRLASALGMWPWCDVFMSADTSNLLLATLSAGVVGIGDEIGKEDTSNILKSVRGDGAIIKPDVPLVPIDKTYIGDGNRTGTRIATTYSDHGKGFKTLYVFAYCDSQGTRTSKALAKDLGVRKKMFFYDYFAQTGRIVQPEDTLSLNYTRDSYAYGILAPIGQSGFAFVGDPDNFVTCGRKRIASLVDGKGVLKASILVAKGEQTVRVCGYAPKMPFFFIYGGFLVTSSFDSVNHIFTLEIQPQENLDYRMEAGDPVGEISVELRRSS